MYDVVWNSHKLMAYPKSSSDPSLAAHGALPEAWYVKLVPVNKQNELTKAVFSMWIISVQKQSHTICLQSWCKFSTVSMKWKEFVRSLAYGWAPLWFLDSEEPYKQTFHGLVWRIQAIGLCQILVPLHLQ